MNDQTVFRLLEASLFTNEYVEIPDWEPVFQEMKKQAIAALPGEWLKNHPIPEAKSWEQFCFSQHGRWIRVMHAQNQMLRLMDEHDIPCVIIKGAAAAMAYPYPMLRTMGDVDFLVKRVDYDRAASLLEENGYQTVCEKDPLQHHYEFSKDGTIIELHKRLRIIDETNESLLMLFENGIDNKERRSINGFSFPVLPAAFNGLVLIFHINQHLRSGIGLRQIVDWMMYMNELEDEKWHEEVLPLLRDTGMDVLALTVTAMCQKYLGLRTIVENKDNYPCDELMNYIMKKGNFGIKEGFDDKTASFVLFTDSKGSVLKRLQDGGMCRWKAAQKHRVLRPFAWIYQSFRITGELLRNGTTPNKMLRQTKEGLDQRKLIEALGLKIDRNIYH